MGANNLVTVDINKVLAPQEVEALDRKIDGVIQKHQKKRKEVNLLTFKCISFLTEGDEAQQKLQNKDFLAKIIGDITGSNKKLANDAAAKRVEAQYISQQILKRMSERSVLGFDLLKAVNNKMNASQVKVNRKFEYLYKALRDFVRYNQSQVVQLSLRIDKVEQNVALLNWQASIEYQMYQGREYIDLTPIEKLVCIARDFYDLTKGQWNTSELLLLKSAMGDIGMDVRDKMNYLTLVQEINKDKELKDYLLGNGDIVIDQADPDYLLCFGALNKLEKLDGDESYLLDTLAEATGDTDAEKLKENVLLSYMKNQAHVDLNTEVTYYDLLLDLLFNMDQCAEESLLIENSEASMDKIYMGQAFDPASGVRDCYSLGHDWYFQAARSGDARAQNALAICYEYGLGAAQNYQKALTWYRKAADNGLPEAMGNLGWCYDRGIGVKVDEKKAVEWYQKAAEEGYVRAQTALGLCYYTGRVVETSEGQAVDLFRQAAEKGHAEAQYNLAICYQIGSGVDLDDSLAVEWYKKAADQGYAFALDELGWCCMNGVGTGKNPKLAAELFGKAAEQGYADAQNHLGECYLKGMGVTADEARAVDLFREAAKQDNVDAQNHLGECYLNGRGVKRNRRKAVKCFKTAANQEHAGAQYHLGFCYRFGLGVEKDIHKALGWFSKAAKQGDEKAAKTLKELGHSY